MGMQVPTRVIFVHGANQGQREPATREADLDVWLSGIESEQDNGEKILDTISGASVDQIREYHDCMDEARVSPWYVGFSNAYYGDVYPGLASLGKRLNPLVDESLDKLEETERRVMSECFDEIVPMYELALIDDLGITLYEAICSRLLDAIEETVEMEESFVLLGHSLGCMVSYHVLNHMSKAVSGADYARTFPGALSEDYRNRLLGIAMHSECMGLLTFANPAGFNLTQRAGHNILFGINENHMRFPSFAPYWRNFWTQWNSDPFIIDDALADTVCDSRYKDVCVQTIPGHNIGHSIAEWMARDDFADKLCRALSEDMYIPAF